VDSSVPEAFSTGQLFAAIDARDASRFAALLQEDAIFQFGNAPAVRGRDAIAESVSGFFASIAAVKHTISEVWQPPGTVICHGHVTYTRHSGSRLTVPFANILSIDSGGVRDYRIFADVSALYADV
jgi:uncharacterized protein (TIGR02246 family)